LVPRWSVLAPISKRGFRMRKLNETKRGMVLPSKLVARLDKKTQDALFVRLADAMDVAQITSFEELDNDSILRDAVASLIESASQKRKVWIA
jgi:hypothetical protein